MLAFKSMTSTKTTRTGCTGSGSQMVEMLQLTEWKNGGLGQLGISVF